MQKLLMIIYDTDSKYKLDKRLQRQLKWANQTDTMDIIVLYDDLQVSATLFIATLSDLIKSQNLVEVDIRVLPRANVVILKVNADIIPTILELSSVVFISSATIDIVIS